MLNKFLKTFNMKVGINLSITKQIKLFFLHYKIKNIYYAILWKISAISKSELANIQQ